MIDQKTFAKYARSPSAFRADLIVDVSGTPRKFSEVEDDWQRSDFEALDPALKKCNGRSKKTAKMRAYLERPRGHSKTTDLGIICTWALAFAARPIRAYAYAADRDQAKLLRDAIHRLVHLNPWLNSIISVRAGNVLNIADGHPGKDSELVISASDASSSFGILPDLLIADELTHWQLNDDKLWVSLLSSAGKRKGCLFVIISNAGMIDSWQYEVREKISNDEAWYFSRLEGPQASWMTESRLDEMRRMLPTIAYARLYENIWSSGGGDALSPEDIDAAFDDRLRPMNGREADYDFVGGLDLGLTRDCSAFVVLGIGRFGTREQGRIQLANAKLWRPTTGKKINLIDVELYVRKMDEQFRLKSMAFDPWQAELMGQRLEFDSPHRARSQKHFGYKPKSWVRPIPANPTWQREIASLVIESFNDSQLKFYEYEPLRRDLHRLRVEEKSYGLRLTSPRDNSGHGDTFSAFALALYVGIELGSKRRNAISVLGNDPGETPWKRATRELEERQEAYAAEMEFLSTPESPTDELRPMMRYLGR